MQPHRLLTPEDYLSFDASSEVRYEYWNGEVVAMAGETYNHNAVKDDLVVALREHTKCDVLSSGLRVRAPGYGRENYAYPDGVVVCGPKDFDESTRPPTLLNPTVLVEVVSDSTRSRDFADKLEAYFRLDSLREYWIVEPDRPYVLRYERAGGHIIVHMIQDLEQSFQSETLGAAVAMRDIYRRVIA